MKKLTLDLLASVGLSSCIVVPVGRYEREVYVAPSATTYYPAHEYRYRAY